MHYLQGQRKEMKKLKKNSFMEIRFEKKDRLEDAILTFIERVVKEPSSDKEIEVLPQMAQVLNELLY